LQKQQADFTIPVFCRKICSLVISFSIFIAAYMLAT